MDLKFYLNKFLKADNIEYYTLDSLYKLKQSYDQFIEKTNGSDPDFPLINFNTKGKKIKGTNVYNLLGDDEDFKGLDSGLMNIHSPSKYEQKENFEYLERVKKENNMVK